MLLLAFGLSDSPYDYEAEDCIKTAAFPGLAVCEVYGAFLLSRTLVKNN